jgi:hypothetical protein
VKQVATQPTISCGYSSSASSVSKRSEGHQRRHQGREGRGESQRLDGRTLMEVIKDPLSTEVRQERKALLDTYLAAFGIDD